MPQIGLFREISTKILIEDWDITIVKLVIQNKYWLVAQITRLSLGGFSQEEISHELKVSEGTVNAIMQELNASDDILKL